MLDNTIVISIQEYDKDLDKVFRYDHCTNLSEFNNLDKPMSYLMDSVNHIREKIKEMKKLTQP